MSMKYLVIAIVVSLSPFFLKTEGLSTEIREEKKEDSSRNVTFSVLFQKDPNVLYGPESLLDSCEIKFTKQGQKFSFDFYEEEFNKEIILATLPVKTGDEVKYTIELEKCLDEEEGDSIKKGTVLIPSEIKSKGLFVFKLNNIEDTNFTCQLKGN